MGKETKMITSILIACLATVALAEAEADPYYKYGYNPTNFKSVTYYYPYNLGYYGNRYQTPSFQYSNNQNRGLQTSRYENRDFQNSGFQNQRFQGQRNEQSGFPNPQFQNPGFQNFGFQNSGLKND